MKVALQLIMLSILITSCSLFNNDKDYQFEAEYKNERIKGSTQVQDFRPDTLFIRGIENGDFMNGRQITIIVEDYKGIGNYSVLDYSFAIITGGDVIEILARAHEPYGEVIITEIKNNVVKGEFTGMFISRDSTETFDMTASFEVVRDFD